MRILTATLMLLGISALGGIFGLLQGGPIDIAPELQRLTPELTRGALLCLAFAYSVLALITAYGAWRGRSWTAVSYLAFSAAAMLLLGFFLYIAPLPMDAFSLVVGPLFIGLIAWGLWKGWRVIETELGTPQRAA